MKNNIDLFVKQYNWFLGKFAEEIEKIREERDCTEEYPLGAFIEPKEIEDEKEQ